jgi:D-lactate dehydrogenase (cytochrome)
VRTARRARKSSAGYDLTRLFVGSEGTLGIITEVTVRLCGVPETVAAAVCSFDSLAGAVNTVIRTIQLGVPIARVELLDDVQMDAVNRYSGLTHPVQDTLFLEFHGSASSVREDAALVQQIATELGGGAFAWAAGHAERRQLWAARHDAAYATKALRPGCGLWATDVCVPISRLAECILETKQDLRASFLLAPLIGHVGDGNFHLGLLVRRDDPREVAEAERLHDRLVQRALAMDGTCTGEHGVGTGKARYLAAEHGDALDVMRAIKQALDPLGIMNPGKVLPP